MTGYDVLMMFSQTFDVNSALTATPHIGKSAKEKKLIGGDINKFLAICRLKDHSEISQ